ncbi:hypothetical protein Tco_1049846 [Tanacetum coccineum]
MLGVGCVWTRYVRMNVRGSALVVHFGFADEGLSRLLWHKFLGVGHDPFSKKLISSSSSITLMVVESEVLNDFPGFVSILIAEFAADGAVNLALKMKGDMIIKNLDERLFVVSPSRWKELSKKVVVDLLPCGDDQCMLRRFKQG